MANIKSDTEIKYNLNDISEVEMVVIYKALGGIDMTTEESNVSEELYDLIRRALNH